MAIFYRGVGLGKFHHSTDPRSTGFSSHRPGLGHSLSTLIEHIKDGATDSPYVSLTRSYSVAWTYAIYTGIDPPTERTPAYVFEVEVNSPCPPGVVVFDPVREIVTSLPGPLSGMAYQHDGFPDFLLGVVDPKTMGHLLSKHVMQPPPGGATRRSAHLSPELETIVRALRDSEILVCGTIPVSCIKRR